MSAAYDQDYLIQYGQYSEFKYDIVDGEQIKENWLIHNFNIMEYREKIYKAMKASQQRYLERKGSKRILNQQENLVSMDEDTGLYTVIPKNPNLALQKRKIIKETRGVISRVVDRHIVLDDQLITCFSREKDSSFKKHIPLDDGEVNIETIHNSKKEKWHDKKSEIRIAIRLQSRNLDPIFFYTNDMNEAKAMKVRLKTSSVDDGIRQKISETIQSLTLLEVVMRFYNIWNKLNRVYEKRLLKMISFQLMGINLIEVAATAWFHRERMFKFWSNKILKRQKKPVLRSTFKHGEIKYFPDAFEFRSSLVVREHVKRLANLFKNRRLLRHNAIQKKLDLIYNEQERGIVCSDISVISSSKNLTMKQGRVKIENNTYFSLEPENISNENGDENFFEANKPIKFALDNIAFLATNYSSKQKGKKDIYTLRIYGRMSAENQIEYNEPIEERNLMPHQLDLDLPRRIPSNLFQITIHSIELPKEFLKKFNQKADLRVKLKQAKSNENLDKGFYVSSKPFRVEIPSNQLQANTSILNCQDYTFTIDQLSETDQNESFKINLVLNRSGVPVKAIMKDLLYEEEFKSNILLKYQNSKNKTIKVKDSKGNSIGIKLSVKKISNTKQQLGQEREGNRLLIGRYVLYDKKKICIVKSLNKDQTVDLLVQTKEFQGISLQKVTLIEKHGVNVFDLNDLPYSVENSSYSWVIDLKSKNLRLINSILTGIRNRQASQIYSMRSVQEQKQANIESNVPGNLFPLNTVTEIEGNILVSVIEARSLSIRGECNPMVKISLNPKFYDKMGQEKTTQIEMLQFETHIVPGTNNPVWVNKQYPLGRIFDLGLFYKDKEALAINFEVFSQSQNKRDTLIGSATLQSSDLMDLQCPAKEKCLVLEKQSNNSYQNFGFLIIQSFFIPKKSTRLKYEILEDQELFKSAEQYFHFKILQQLMVFDQYDHVVPRQSFHPLFVEYSTTLLFKNQITSSNPLINLKDKNQKEKMQQNLDEMLSLKSPLLLSHDKTADKASNPSLIQLLNKFCSLEEQLATQLKNVNTTRPLIEEGPLVFKYLWKYRVYQARQGAFMELQLKFWNSFIKEFQQAMQHTTQMVSIDDIPADLLNSDGSFSIDILDKYGKSAQKRSNFSWFGRQNPNNEEQKGEANQKSDQQRNQLMLRSIWEQENDQRYADLFHLIQSGIPQELRIIVWKDLLNTSFLEQQEVKVFQSKNAINYDNQKSIYQNYKDLSHKSDCLAFRQIDEDIENFEFSPHFASNLDYNQRMLLLSKQKRKMRNILRVLLLWSKYKKIDNKEVSYSYTKGLLCILQKLVTIAQEEEAFWVLNGLIRPIPRLFSTDVSCLEGGRQSVLRNEMTIFKAVLRENLPQISDKLRMLGLPVEQLIYDSVGSLYSNFFSTEIVFRLWDLIIFNMSTKDKAERRRAVWYIMCPAYLVLREKQEEILNCSTVSQVCDVYNDGKSLAYNPDWIISQLRFLIKEIFVTGTQRFQEMASQNNGSSTGMNFGLSMINSLISKGKASFMTDKAQQLEQTRGKFERDLSEIFNSIELENKYIGQLLSKTNYETVQGQIQYMDYIKWRTHVMAKFKKVALKNSAAIEDDLYEFDEPNLNKENLDLSKINIYLHQISNLIGIKLYRLKLSYGKLNQDGVFSSIEFYDSGDIFSSLKIQQYHVYDYMEGYNYFKIEILDPNKDDVLFLNQNCIQEAACDLLIDLRQINANRFVKKWIQMKNEFLLESPDSYRFPFTAFEISFFLQTHTSVQHSEMMKKRNTTMSQFINSIKRKLPDRIDIFNKKNETDFVNLMKGDFQRIIQAEFENLKCFLPISQAQNTINDHYNYAMDSDFGDITIENLEFLVSQCFFSEWFDYLDHIYKIFVKEQADGEGPQTLNKKTVALTSKKSSTQISAQQLNLNRLNRSKSPNPDRRNMKFKDNLDGLFDNIQQNSKVPFSLRNFLVSLVLMSHCTMNEKFDVLYDIFDWNDGVADGLDLNSIFLLLKTIYERNLYYWPSHELFNLIELSFDTSVSTVYQALWSREPNIAVNRKHVKLKELLTNHELVSVDEGMSIDVTEQVQDTLSSYHRMFGTKNIDFNFDSSPFKNIELLFKHGKELINITSKVESSTKYRLVLFCIVSGEKFMFEVQYDQEGNIQKNRELIDKDDLDEYLKKNINKLFLQGRTSGITKHEFMEKTASIPFLHDLVRVETFYRDRVQNTLRKKKRLDEQVVILLNVDQILILFRFQTKMMSNVEGEIKNVGENAYKIMMTAAFEEDTVADLRERMTIVLTKLSENNNIIKKLNQQYQIIENIEGTREFLVRVSNEGGEQKWKKVREFERIVRFLGESFDSQIVFKLEKIKYIASGQQATYSSDRGSDGYDCYTLYKHQDFSYEWRLCKIVHKEPIMRGAKRDPQMSQIMKNKDETQKFFYWLEFLHLKEHGQSMWVKRKREEVLISARYAREQQRNFEQSSLKFIKDTYQFSDENKEYSVPERNLGMKKQMFKR